MEVNDADSNATNLDGSNYAVADMAPRGTRHDVGEDDYFQGAVGGGAYRTELVSADANHVTLSDLRPDTSYLIEVHAIVDSGEREEELAGERATLVVQTRLDVTVDTSTKASTQQMTTVTPPSPSSVQSAPPDPRIVALQLVDAPHYENGQHLVRVRWTIEQSPHVDRREFELAFAIEWAPDVAKCATALKSRTSGKKDGDDEDGEEDARGSLAMSAVSRVGSVILPPCYKFTLRWLNTPSPISVTHVHTS
jgi:hypothetical protein